MIPDVFMDCDENYLTIQNVMLLQQGKPFYSKNYDI